MQVGYIGREIPYELYAIVSLRAIVASQQNLFIYFLGEGHPLLDIP